MKKSFYITLIFTTSLFLLALLLNHGIDYIRIDKINNILKENENTLLAQITKEEFLTELKEESCSKIKINELKEQIAETESRIGAYKKISLFNQKEFEILQRKHIFSQLKLYSLIKNMKCEEKIIPLLFFYEEEQEDSSRQGFILQELAKVYEENTALISLNANYDESLVEEMTRTFNITTTPTIIIEEEKLEGIHFEAEIKKILEMHLR